MQYFVLLRQILMELFKKRGLEESGWAHIAGDLEPSNWNDVLVFDKVGEL